MLDEAETVEWVKNHAIGSTMPNLNTSILENIPVRFPDINQQEKVERMVSAYDTLIENNQKQIKLLEEAARRLYKEWFVDLRFPGHEHTPILNGIPEGWRKGTIGSLAVYLNGYAFKPSDWGISGYPIIKIREMNDGVGTDTPRNEGRGIPDKYLILRGDLLFSWSATLTAMLWTGEDGLLNQHIFKVIPKLGMDKMYVLQAILHTLEEFRNLANGATMKHIKRGKLDEVATLIPNTKIMELFSIFTSPIKEKIILLSRSTQHLTEARDRLLPKLMSGEIAIK